MRGTLALTYGIVVRITNERDLPKAIIAVKEKSHSGSCYVYPVDVRMSQGKGILIDLVEECTPTGSPCPCHSDSIITPRVALRQSTR